MLVGPSGGTRLRLLLRQVVWMRVGGRGGELGNLALQALQRLR